MRSFEVGKHIIRVSETEHRWTVTVDDMAYDSWYMTQAAAWEAGVREADRLDRSEA